MIRPKSAGGGPNEKFDRLKRREFIALVGGLTAHWWDLTTAEK
jgi:hypothetical protein